MTRLCALLALGACTTEQPEMIKPTLRERAPLLTGEEQHDRLCGRSRSDLVVDTFCSNGAPIIRGFQDLRLALGFTDEPSNVAGFAMTGHSTSLVARSISAINPRVIFARAETAAEMGSLVGLAFARGEQFSEAVVRDRLSGELRFYLATFKQDCNDAPGGCTPGDLLTEAVETGWKDVNIYAEDDLVNTTLDCLVCHQPDGPGTPKLLRMQELNAPWTHWFFQLTEGGQALVADYVAAKGDESFAGIRGSDAIQSNPGLLSFTLFVAGSGKQPNMFESSQIEREVKESAAALGGNQPSDNSIPGQSPTWEAIYDRAKRGLEIAVPYHDVKVTDPEKLARMTAAYVDYREGRLAREDLPDIRDVYPDDPALLARMGFSTEPGLDGPGILRQACGQCHNGRLDQSLSRSRFNIDALSHDSRMHAAARLLLPHDSPELMPPARFKTLSDEARTRLVQYLMQ